MPLTGEQNRITGFFLSAITGVPALTGSPSFTRSFGLSPLKSVGLTAKMSGEMLLAIWFIALPFSGMFKPLRKSILFDILKG